MATTKVQTGLRIDEAMYEKLVYLAKEQGRSLNNMTEYIIRCYLNQYEREHGRIPIQTDEQTSFPDV